MTPLWPRVCLSCPVNMACAVLRHLVLLAVAVMDYFILPALSYGPQESYRQIAATA